jgi:hypothetical protein
MTEHHAGDDLTQLGQGFIYVRLYEILDRQSLSEGVVAAGTLRLHARAQVARSPEMLPPSKEDFFERSFHLLERFVAREGHAAVPEDWREEDVALGAWVANIRHYHMLGELRPEWVARLESLRGWRWSTSG